jgi:hypothetical protein
LSIVRSAIPPIDSAVDVGCGVGTWLHVLSEKGVSEIHGVDGDWVKTEYLVIPESCFTTHDLSRDVKLPNRFDLAVSLEVAEHLPATNAAQFVDTLTSLSDFVLFSAAIPGQGGIKHVNEQWPSYWFSLFADRGYIPLDFIRKQIWQDESIPFWYRQNVFLMVDKDRVNEVSIDQSPVAATPPEQYLIYFDKLVRPLGIKQSVKSFLLAMKRQLTYR